MTPAVPPLPRRLAAVPGTAALPRTAGGGGSRAPPVGRATGPDASRPIPSGAAGDA